MDVAHYEIFLSFLRSLPLPLTEWAYPAFVKTSEYRIFLSCEERIHGTGNKERGDLRVGCQL